MKKNSSLRSAFRSHFHTVALAAAALAAAIAPALAQDDSREDEDRPEILDTIGVVEISRIFRDSEYIGRNRDEVNAEFVERVEQLEQMNEQIAEKREQLDRDQLGMTAADRTALLEEIDQLTVRLQREERNLREDKRLAFDSRQRHLEKEVMEVIAELGSQKKLHMVLELNAVLIAGESLDFTDEVIAKLDSDNADEQ
ncbi:MAG: OmpH family outer membrane protein [Betaproteobacteria bacterium]|nr:OmpH family outer membrane protein [Betaproteobacteria bacterium]